MLLANAKLAAAAATPVPLSYQYTRIKPGILPLPYTAAAAPAAAVLPGDAGFWVLGRQLLTRIACLVAHSYRILYLRRARCSRVRRGVGLWQRVAACDRGVGVVVWRCVAACGSTSRLRALCHRKLCM